MTTPEEESDAGVAIEAAPQLVSWMARALLGPQLRRRGFKGSSARWSRSNEYGDLGLVELQRGRMNTREAATFAVNVAVCPEPYVRWSREVLGHRGAVNHGDGIIRVRQGLYVDGRGADADYWWEVRSRPDAEVAAQEVIAALDDFGLPLLERYLDRQELVRAAWDKRKHFRRLNDGFLPAILLSDSGPSPELNRALELLDADPRWAETARWVRARSDAAASQ